MEEAACNHGDHVIQFPLTRPMQHASPKLMHRDIQLSYQKTLGVHDDKTTGQIQFSQIFYNIIGLFFSALNLEQGRVFPSLLKNIYLQHLFPYPLKVSILKYLEKGALCGELRGLRGIEKKHAHYKLASLSHKYTQASTNTYTFP